VSNSTPNLPWKSIASSADGSMLAAVWGGASVFLSTNSGSSWSSNNIGGDLISIASSADGKKLITASNVGIGSIYTSSDGGRTWISNNVPSNVLRSVTCSADGSRLVAAANGSIYTSYSTPSPQLTFAPSGGHLVLSWIVPSTNFILQQTSNIRATNWIASGNYPTLNLTNLQEELKFPLLPAYPINFYRLKQQ
jgi:hypothetical protein